MGLLPLNCDILSPADDRVFKLLLTSPEGKPVLIDLISAVIGRTVLDVEIRNNELPTNDTEEKAERLDVNCKINDGSQVDLEMQASRIEELQGGHRNLKGKSIYYLCDLHSSQSAKGVDRYDLLVQTYQVTFCTYTVFPKLTYVNSFSLRNDITNELLSDVIRVIFIELSKLGEILKKPVQEMSDLEKWSVFFRYANAPKYRETVNAVIETKEELQMAGELLMSISQDERERAVLRSRRMFQTDLASNMATAEARGEMRGEARGRADIARKMKNRGRPLEEIVEDTGFSPEEIARL